MAPVQTQVTAVWNASGARLPLYFIPSTGLPNTQLVTGIAPNETYTIQVQLLAGNNEPLTGLPLLGLTASEFAGDLSVVPSARPKRSTLAVDRLGRNYLYLTCRSGSAGNIADDLSLFSTQEGPTTISFYLATNGF